MLITWLNLDVVEFPVDIQLRQGKVVRFLKLSTSSEIIENRYLFLIVIVLGVLLSELQTLDFILFILFLIFIFNFILFSIYYFENKS